MYFNKKGELIALDEFSKLFTDRSYQVLKQTRLESGLFEGGMVSTIWLGLDHSFNSDGPPVIFESMVFDKEGLEVDCSRGCTEEEIMDYHWGYVRHYNKEPTTSRFEKLELE